MVCELKLFNSATKIKEIGKRGYIKTVMQKVYNEKDFVALQNMLQGSSQFILTPLTHGREEP